MSKYKATGFPVGRPRNGEIRPITDEILRQRAWRNANKEKLKEYTREKSAEWRKNNPERARQLARLAYARRKAYSDWASLHNDAITIQVTITQ